MTSVFSGCRVWIAAVVAFGAVLAAPLAAHAQAANQPAAAQKLTTLDFCNNTGSKVFIALVYYEHRTSKWMLTAWQSRNAGECKSAGKFRSGITYYYAEKEGRGLHWPSAGNVDKTFCVPSGKVERVQMGGTCAAGERNVGFHGINATGESYKFSLNN